jgi:hypothetical protein
MRKGQGAAPYRAAARVLARAHEVIEQTFRTASIDGGEPL